MCAQFKVSVTPEELTQLLGLPPQTTASPNWKPRFLPYTYAPVIRYQKQFQIDLMNFSLIPAWSESPKPKFATHNARIETILEKPTWKKPFCQRRCLIPINAFYEPIYEGTWANNMVEFSSDFLLFAAGIWDSWQPPDGGAPKLSFSILTTEPSPQIKEAGHDRSPIFLQEAQWQKWLNAQDPKNFQDPNKDRIWLLKEKFQPNFKISIDRPLKKKSF